MEIAYNIGKLFSDKVLVITGGTGSFGSTVLKHFITSELREIRILSRDEMSQYALLLAVLLSLYILFVPGSKGDNEYGSDTLGDNE